MTETAWILLFRGVGGKTQLPVAPLRERLGEAGFRDVRTYINSGNAVLASSLDREEVANRVAQICAREFGFDKDIHVVSLPEWDRLIDRNPFPDAVAVPKFLHAANLAADPDPAAVTALQEIASVGSDRIEIVGRVAYLHTPDGFGTSKLAERFDRTIGVPNTSRNWNTVTKLMAIAQEVAAALRN